MPHSPEHQPPPPLRAGALPTASMSYQNNSSPGGAHLSPPTQGYPIPVDPATLSHSYSRQKRQLSIPEIEEYENREEKRRKSHSEMERERRRKTNLIIEELRDIIPGLKEQKNLHKLHIFEATLAFVKEHIKECTTTVRRAEDKETTQCICIEQPESCGNMSTSSDVSESSESLPPPKIRRRCRHASIRTAVTTVAKTFTSTPGSAANAPNLRSLSPPLTAILTTPAIDASKELINKPRYSSNISDKSTLLKNAPSSPSKSSIEFLTG
ncbi:hypothetical protein GGH96_000683 [Coemansia sp. RSA 1972]|nr:hypothetical protein GGH96_000683 [Coemansia sp. RSA 1972]